MYSGLPNQQPTKHKYSVCNLIRLAEYMIAGLVQIQPISVLEF